MSKTDEKLILLVEDNPDDEFLALNVLAKENMSNNVIVVRDGQEALDYLFYQGNFVSRPKSNPQIILLDLKLPKVDGLKVLQDIRRTEETKLIPVVILTSSQLETDIADSYAGGANGYIVKPVDIEQFSSSIKQFINYWIRLNKNWE